jgi:hypothetical protein
MSLKSPERETPLSSAYTVVIRVITGIRIIRVSNCTVVTRVITGIRIIRVSKYTVVIRVIRF